MEPLDALNEVAFRLEHERAPGFKVKAFRRAAGIVETWSAEELAARLADGRLKSTKGIGDRTFEIIAQAAEGRVPDYLADLRARAGEELDPVGAELRALLRGDLHAHSDWSDGTTDIRSMADAAIALGHEYQALTDHSPNLKIAHGLTADRLEQQLGIVAALNEALGGGDASGFRLLSGIEVDILEDGGLDQQPGLLDRLDVVVASVHSKLRSDRSTMTRRMLAAVDDPHTDVLGHVTGRLVEGSRGTRPQSEFDAAAVFAACAANQVAVEINSRPERQDPPDDLIRVALDAGCLFSIDSDAHAPGHLAFLDLGAARAAAAGVPADRIVTTWPLDRLLAWTARNR
ncbi:PHP domain-containing protein [Herbiconiux solani]|uniref:PHP domain-containing protein n=1 Tax=Herbiconiux solani TaxID=661329 RepID=UPI000825C2AD|nr:PHP domain-containing protein [Herbiconiux solani]